MTARHPVSTYRLQIRAAFDLDAAAEVTGYLRDLGVDWAYLSPLLKATAGSDHGYDVVDPSQVDPARGGAAGLSRFRAAARAAGLGVLVDIVPNHMGISRPDENPWWWDVLRHGRSSVYADAFDIDWEYGGGKVRVPILGAEPEEVIAAGEIVVDADAGLVRYHEHALPLAPGSTTGIDPTDVAAVLVAPELGGDVLAPRGGGAQLPPLLRRDDPRRRAGRGAARVRRGARRGAALGAGGSRRRTAHRPPRRSRRPRRLPRPAGRGHRRRLRAGGEDPRARRDRPPRGAAGLVAHRGDDRLRRDGRDRPRAGRPGGRSRPRPPRRGAAPRDGGRRLDRIRRPRPRDQADDRRHDPAGRDRPPRARARRRGARARRRPRDAHRRAGRTPRELSGVPLLPARRGGAPRPRTRRDETPPPRPGRHRR